MTKTQTPEPPLTTLEIGKKLDENELALQAAIEAERRAVQAREAAQVDMWCGRGNDRLTAAQTALDAATKARVDLEDQRRILNSSMIFAKEREKIERIARRRIEEAEEAKERAALLARRAEIKAEDAQIEAKVRALNHNKAGVGYLQSDLASFRRQHPELLEAPARMQLSDIMRQEPVTELNTVPLKISPAHGFTATTPPTPVTAPDQTARRALLSDIQRQVMA